jgi:predicted N-acyltransferase
MKASVAASLRIVEADSLAGVSAPEWNALTGASDPFLEYEFLRAMETSSAIGEGSGWLPTYVMARRDGDLVGALPVFT